ncbi:MAG: tetratricopeptide repeat protein [Acidobacteriota bacterium]
MSLSGIHLEQDRPLAAEATAREAYEVFSSTLPDGHFITAIAACRLGRSLIGLGEAEEARRYFDLSTGPLLETTRYPDYRRECLEAAADLHDAWGETEPASSLRAAIRR